MQNLLGGYGLFLEVCNEFLRLLRANKQNHTLVLETIPIVLHRSDVHVDLFDFGLQSNWLLDPLLTYKNARPAKNNARYCCAITG